MPGPDDTLRRCTLAILAGGEGSRMGKPKGLLEIQRQPILKWLLDRLTWPGPTLLVTAPGREHPPGCDQFDREATDPVAGEGPLRGIHTALEAAATPVVVITTIDMPGIRMTQLFWLVGELTALQDPPAVMCRRAAACIEPFPLAIRRDASPAILSRLATGDRSVRALADTGLAATVSCPAEWPDATWANLNRPDDLEAWLSGAAPHDLGSDDI